MSFRLQAQSCRAVRIFRRRAQQINSRLPNHASEDDALASCRNKASPSQHAASEIPARYITSQESSSPTRSASSASTSGLASDCLRQLQLKELSSLEANGGKLDSKHPRLLHLHQGSSQPCDLAAKLHVGLSGFAVCPTLSKQKKFPDSRHSNLQESSHTSCDHRSRMPSATSGVPPPPRKLCSRKAQPAEASSPGAVQGLGQNTPGIRTPL